MILLTVDFGNFPMKQTQIDELIDVVFGAGHVLRRKLFRLDAEGRPLSLLHFHILSMLCDTGPLPVSEIGRRLLISKPQMTRLVDKLIEQKTVERIPDEKDRRVIRIGLTAEGAARIEEYMAIMRTSLRKALANLDGGEAAELARSFRSIVEIISRLEQPAAGD